MKDGNSDFRLAWPALQRALPQPPSTEDMQQLGVTKSLVVHANDLDKPHPWRYVRWQKAHDRQVRSISLQKSERSKGNFVYKVIPREDLNDIALKHETFKEVVMEANGILNPENVAVGQLLFIPRAHQIQRANGNLNPENVVVGQLLFIPRAHQIQRWNTLWSLSRKYGVSIPTIQVANGIENPNLIYAGEIILIPNEPCF